MQIRPFLAALILFAAPAYAAPSFSVADVSCPEAGPCAVTVRKNVKASSYSKVTVTTVDGTAKVGTDYQAVNVTLTFGNNQLLQTVPVAIVNNTVTEPSETFTVKLTAVRNAVIGRSPATVTIVDDDLAPAVWVKCADENRTCTINGTAVVRYGSGTTWLTKTVTGSIACTNAVWTDPVPNVVKECDTTGVVVAPSPTPSPTPTPPPTGSWVAAPIAEGGYVQVVTAQPGWPIQGFYDPVTGQPTVVRMFDYTSTYRSSVVGEVCRIYPNGAGYDFLSRRTYSVKCLFDSSALILLAANLTGVAPAAGYTPPF